MDIASRWKGATHPDPGAWRVDEANLSEDDSRAPSIDSELANCAPQDQSKLLGLLGEINHKILCGDLLYIEMCGLVYKVRYGVYWRSVFTGDEHYLLKCEEIKDGMWQEDDEAACEIDLPVRYTPQGWLINDQSARFIERL
jgi:hypothetical protein